MFRRKNVPASFIAQQEVEKTRRRVSRMSEREMLDWADVAGSGMYKAFRDYRGGDTDALHDIKTALIGMVAIYEELSGDESNQ